MGSMGSLCCAMGLYGVSMALYGVSMWPYGVSMGFCGSLWDLYGALWGLYGVLWVSMGSLWGSMGRIDHKGGVAKTSGRGLRKEWGGLLSGRRGLSVDWSRSSAGAGLNEGAGRWAGLEYVLE